MFRRNKETRRLPNYFRRDHVGGLSHLFSLTSRSGGLGDLHSYGDTLEARFGYDYAFMSMVGIACLLASDKKKYAKLDELCPDPPPRNELESQQLLSVVIHAACEPVIKHEDLAKLLFPKTRTRQKAISYMSAVILECNAVADGWWVTTGNTPIRPSSIDQITRKNIERLIIEFWRLMTDSLDQSLFESVNPLDAQENLLMVETNLAAAKGTVDAMQRIWPDGENVFDRFNLAISELLLRRPLIEEFSNLFELDLPPDELTHRSQEIISKNREILMIVGTYISEAADILNDLTGIRLET